MAIRLGRTVFIKMDTANVGGASASWSLIGQQTDAGFDAKNETVDGTTKSDYGWTNEIAIGRSWTITCECKLDPASSVWLALYADWKAGTKRWIQIDESAAGGSKEEVQAYVEISKKYPLKDVVTATINFSCQGAPVASVV